MGPGVEETDVAVGVGVVVVVVTTGVGVGVTGGVAGCRHPAASTSTMQNRHEDAIINDFFIPDSCPGGYLMVVLKGEKEGFFYIINKIRRNMREGKYRKTQLKK